MWKLLALSLALAGCKGSDSKSEPAPAPTKSNEQARTKPTLPPTEEVLPSEFPLPAGQNKLVRAHKKLTMLVWEYAYPDLAPAEAQKRIVDEMILRGWTVAKQDPIRASHAGRLYVVTTAASDKGSVLTIRSFPEAGPTTLNAPTSYPSKFPFLAGGTSSHAPDGAKLTVAYQSDPRDIEQAMIVAAEGAGWTCTGTGSVTCTQGKSRVTFTTEAATGGSLLVVSGL